MERLGNWYKSAVFSRADTLPGSTWLNVSKGEGLLGKISKDDALYVQLRESIAKFTALAERISQEVRSEAVCRSLAVHQLVTPQQSDQAALRFSSGSEIPEDQVWPVLMR
jgi:hypothetical protein